MMQINTDHALRVVINTHEVAWTAAPVPGVHRRFLERDGEELARATAIVRYEKGAAFSSPTHEGGEEILVLEGTLIDEWGNYGPGTYLKNPAGTQPTPRSGSGCTLFVKLRHLDPDDQQRVNINTQQSSWYQGLVPGLSVLPLSEYGSQHTALVRWAPNTFFQPHRHYGGEEIYVLEGTFEDEHGSYPTGTWIRSPHGSLHQPYSRTGCLIWVKTGHLSVALA